MEHEKSWDTFGTPASPFASLFIDIQAACNITDYGDGFMPVPYGTPTRSLRWKAFQMHDINFIADG